MSKVKNIFKTALMSTLIVFSINANAKSIVDLTYAFNKSTLHWPTANPFQLKKDFAGEAPGGYFYAINDFCTAEHVGTHMDAPLHFAKNHIGVADVPLSKLVGNAIMIDVTNKTTNNSDYQITIEDFKQWENQHGAIPSQSIILLNTGYNHYWGNQKKYLGTTLLGAQAIAKLHFPGLDPDAAKWLINSRNVKSIGIDTASIDYGQSKKFLTHQVLAAANVPFFENVANVSSLPANGFLVYALPMKITGGTGAPVRIIAML
ncbi:MAG: cyclase family protein [Gammaproteobacteria bacterium]